MEHVKIVHPSQVIENLRLRFAKRPMHEAITAGEAHEIMLCVLGLDTRLRQHQEETATLFRGVAAVLEGQLSAEALRKIGMR